MISVVCGCQKKRETINVIMYYLEAVKSWDTSSNTKNIMFLMSIFLIKISCHGIFLCSQSYRVSFYKNTVQSRYYFIGQIRPVIPRGAYFRKQAYFQERISSWDTSLATNMIHMCDFRAIIVGKCFGYE